MNCGLCERALPGDVSAWLCPGCTRATGERLARLPALYGALSLFLAPARRPGRGGRVRLAEAPLPVSEPVLSLIGEGGVVSVLESWHSALCEALGWTQPVPRGSVEQRVRSAADALYLNVLWVADSWCAAGDFAAEVRDLERAILSIVDPPAKSRRLGYCPTVDASGVLCGAVISLPEGATEARCRWCGTRYGSDSWLALARAQQAAA